MDLPRFFSKSALSGFHEIVRSEFLSGLKLDQTKLLRAETNGGTQSK